MAKPNLLESRNGRFIAFGFLYMSEGIPYGFATTAMVMFMRLEGLSIEQIGGFVAAVLLPWGFKWAWASLAVLPFLKNREVRDTVACLEPVRISAG